MSIHRSFCKPQNLLLQIVENPKPYCIAQPRIELHFWIITYSSSTNIGVAKMIVEKVTKSGVQAVKIHVILDDPGSPISDYWILFIYASMKPTVLPKMV